jgi:hypothetical protein
MTKINFKGSVWTLPYRGRFGCQIRDTLNVIINHPEGIALYAAMGLRGRAKSYEGKYRASFARFAKANTDKLVAGTVGPKGGFGYQLRQVYAQVPGGPPCGV